MTKNIRRCAINEIKARLKQQYDNLAYDPASALPGLILNNFTRKYIKHILARITSYIEEETDTVPNYVNYMNYWVKDPFEIEHIITDHYEWFTEEYADPDEFRRRRNSIGALLLLRKSINSSLNDSLYDAKLKKYCSNEGNIYTESLGDQAYQNNPRFKRFINDHNLNFKPFSQFGKTEINERIVLLIQLVKLIWNTEMFEETPAE